jgi:hypothetical protein
LGFELQETTIIMHNLIFNYYSILYNAHRNSIDVHVVNTLKVEKKDVIVVYQEASNGDWYASGVRL